MAEIVLGVGTSHSPSLSMGPQWWATHGTYFDPKLERIADFEERCARAPEWLRAELDPAVFKRKHDAAAAAIATLAAALRASAPDIVLVVGDDQHEMFPADELAALALFAGDTLIDLPSNLEQSPPSIRDADWALHGREITEWPASQELGAYLARELTAQDFDVYQLARHPPERTLGHAFTFVFRRLLADGGALPAMVPIFLNTYYPPTQMRARRCWALGRAIRRALDAWDADARVAIVGSGGLSHFMLDPELDRRVLAALGAYDEAAIAAIPESALQSGSSEIKNWVVAGAALEGFRMRVVDYVSAYRTGAATGIGLAFALWERAA